MARKRKGEIDHKALKSAVHEHLRDRSGRRPQWDMIRAQFPDVSLPTIYRTRDAVLRVHPELQRTKGRRPEKRVEKPPPQKPLPIRPPTENIEPVVLPTRSGVSLSVLSMWREVLTDAELALAYYRPKKSGEKPVDARYFLDSATLKARVVSDMLKAMTRIWNVDRIQFLYDTIIKHLHGRDPEFANAVLSDIERAYREAGITIDSVRL